MLTGVSAVSVAEISAPRNRPSSNKLARASIVESIVGLGELALPAVRRKGSNHLRNRYSSELTHGRIFLLFETGGNGLTACAITTTVVDLETNHSAKRESSYRDSRVRKGGQCP